MMLGFQEQIHFVCMYLLMMVVGALARLGFGLIDYSHRQLGIRPDFFPRLFPIDLTRRLV